MEACLAAKGLYFEKEHFKGTALESEEDMSEEICFHFFFFFFFLEGYGLLFSQNKV